MEDIGRLLSMCVDGLKHTFVIYGYEISWWQILVFSIVASLICKLIVGIIG